MSDLLADDGFRVGLLFGTLAMLGVGLRTRRHPGKRLRVGAILTGAVLFALAVQSLLAVGLVLGLIVLGAGAVLAKGRHSVGGRLIRTFPGGLIVAIASQQGGAVWVVPTVLVVVVGGGLLVAEFDRRVAGTGLPLVLVAVTVLGVWGTTPETEHAIVLAGVAVPMALLAWPLRAPTSLGAVGAYLVTALVGWTAAFDGEARSSAVLGGLACLGMLLIEPAVHRRHPFLRPLGPVLDVNERRNEWWWFGLVLTMHVAVVAMSSRVAGLRTAAGPGLAIIAATYVAAAGVTAAIAAMTQRRQPTM